MLQINGRVHFSEEGGGLRLSFLETLPDSEKSKKSFHSVVAIMTHNLNGLAYTNFLLLSH